MECPIDPVDHHTDLTPGGETRRAWSYERRLPEIFKVVSAITNGAIGCKVDLDVAVRLGVAVSKPE